MFYRFVSGFLLGWLCLLFNTAESKKCTYCAPYITGNTFRAFSNFIIDDTQIPFHPEKVKNGDVIFVKTNYLYQFFGKFHQQIKSKYILITHNCDESIPREFSRFLDDEKLIAWFGQNTENYVHKKLHPLPLGIENYHCWEDIGVVDQVIANISTYNKNFLLYMNFRIETYPGERSKLFNAFSGQPFCTVGAPKKFAKYLDDLAHSKFVLSPRGNGLDCYRTWEALLVGTIPIVKKSTLDPLFDDLPVLLIDDWAEITEEFLKIKWNEMKSRNYNLKKLYAPFWLDLISSYKDKST